MLFPLPYSEDFNQMFSGTEDRTTVNERRSQIPLIDVIRLNGIPFRVCCLLTTVGDCCRRFLDLGRLLTTYQNLSLEQGRLRTLLTSMSTVELKQDILWHSIYLLGRFGTDLRTCCFNTLSFTTKQVDDVKSQ